MAAANYTPILLYASGTATNVPLAANLTSTATGAEIAINYADGKLYYKDSGGVVQLLAFKDPTAGIFANDISVNGLTVGLGNGAVATNTAVGYQAISSSATGTGNAAIGYQALTALTSGVQNTALGFQPAHSNLTGSRNTTIGYRAAYNTTTDDVTAIGYRTLFTNSTGTANVAVGTDALYTNNASNNTAVGYQAGYGNTTGAGNTFVGIYSGYSVTNSSNNTFVGNASGPNTVTAGTGSNNTGVGYQAGNALTSGSNNTIIGGYSGNNGGLDIRTASGYIVLSDGAGNPRIYYDGTRWNVPRYNSNTYVTNTGNYSMQMAANGNGGLYVENDSYAGPFGLTVNTIATGSDMRALNVLSNGTQVGSITYTTSTTTYATSSDYRLKENVQPMTGALAVVEQLNPVTYDWKVDGSAGQGFIAHELQAVVPDCVIGKKDAVDADGNPVYQGIDTSFLVATLTAAIKELKAEFDAYKATHP